MSNYPFFQWLYRSISSLRERILRLKSKTTILAEGHKANLDSDNMPNHVAIIMDGNGRWATRQLKPRLVGHSNALNAVKEVVQGCLDLGIPYLTLFAFSTENWKRPPQEVSHLMGLIEQVTRKELSELAEKQVCVTFIGDRERLPVDCRQAIEELERETQHYTKLQLTIALSYSGRWDVVEAVKSVVNDVQHGLLTLDNFDEAVFSQYLTTRELPDPALLIRTSGEMRLSNFLLWQSAYTELFFAPVLWPDFKRSHLCEAIMAYQRRDRRFGEKLSV